MSEVRQIGKTLHPDLQKLMAKCHYKNMLQLAQATRIPRASLRQYLFGERVMPFPVAKVLSEAFRCSLERLYEIYEEIYPVGGTCASNEAQDTLTCVENKY